jgi:hypothetical protein
MQTTTTTPSIVFGIDVDDPGERKYNILTAETVLETLQDIIPGIQIVGLKRDSQFATTAPVINLCDGDEDNSYGMVTFAKAMESAGIPFTGHGSATLELGKNKTLAWLPPRMRPKFWLHQPDQKYILKPKHAHGSLFINHENIEGNPANFSDDFFFQEWLPGKEVTVCFIGPEAIGLCLLRADGSIITRDDKWEDTRVLNPPKREWHHKATLPTEWQAAWALAEEAWALLLAHETKPLSNCYGRVDIRFNGDNEPKVIDINPNAYLGRDGLMASCAGSLGINYREFIRKVLNPSHQRTPTA